MSPHVSRAARGGAILYAPADDGRAYELGGMAMAASTVRVGRRGSIALPEELRRRFGIEEGSLIIAEESEHGILVRPMSARDTEEYTPERRAEFLLSNAVDGEEYARMANEVRKMGLDPDRIVHHRPTA